MGAVIERPLRAFLQHHAIGHTGHVRIYSSDEIRELLTTFGFDVRQTFYNFASGTVSAGAVVRLVIAPLLFRVTVT